jgi:MYXO-CTERM domain-containing protein
MHPNCAISRFGNHRVNQEKLMRIRSLALLAAGLAVCAAPSARAAIVITEWMYSGTSPEFVEITNVGAAPVDLTGWSYDDNSRTAGSTSLTSLGILAPGESAIIAEALTAAEFHAEWGTPNTLKVAAGNTNNLGRNDEINIYDSASALADRLTYNDQGVGDVAGPRTQFISGNPTSLAALGANNATLWTLSSVGDSYGSFASAQFDVGNPGLFSVVPEPTALALAAFGLACLRRRRRA